jgi:myo-inositol 2-dehydrogenase/D-chiro-inositol 1-dehydrogenase
MVRTRPAHYAAALDHFVTAVQGGTAPTPSLGDRLKAQAIAEAATRSLRTGRSERIEY